MFSRVQTIQEGRRVKLGRRLACIRDIIRLHKSTLVNTLDTLEAYQRTLSGANAFVTSSTVSGAAALHGNEKLRA